MRPAEDSAFSVKEVLFFEEIYDSTNLKAVLRIHSSKETFTYFQDIETRQTFLHTSSAHNATCNLIKTSSDIFGPLETKEGWHYFYLRDLLTSSNWSTTPDEAHYPARNMSCNVWVAETERKGRPLIIAMAVNSRSWGSTTWTIRAPVSVRTRYTNSEDDDEIEINIFDFGAFGDNIHDDLLQTVKRGIPCHMWEVVRSDWPPESEGISTLWEWCFVVPKGEEGKRTSGNTYMVSLDITVLQVPSESENSLSLEEGTRLSYNFYDSFKNPPELIDLHGFDISPCYKDNDSVDAYLEVKHHSLRVTRVKGVNLTVSSWGFGLPLGLKPQPAPPPTTDAPAPTQTTTVAETTPTEQVTTATSSSATTKADVPTTTWEIITKAVVTDSPSVVSHDWDTTTSTYDIITELPEAYSSFGTRYSPGVVGGTTVGLFLLGALIGASATYMKSAFFSTASLPTTVFH
ncbi:hypothetical protein HPB52_022014 [Rhipicephalus sanguineus]|uniref:LolA-like domain-containing protein n=1 Tax=Rhipicephalus sanguineus TaxID=34632 RepID=A0A9D4PV58_RHISA|nr:hypothetical protein HPB52_022014 [Rhipicephalus sanguineus]